MQILFAKTKNFNVLNRVCALIHRDAVTIKPTVLTVQTRLSVMPMEWMGKTQIMINQEAIIGIL